jgi:hypothetical protein
VKWKEILDMESLLIKEFVAKEQEAYKLRIRVSKILSPKDLRCVDFIGEQYNDDGKMIDSSTYTFFLTDREIAGLCKELHP